MIFSFNLKYFFLTVILFSIELVIALFVKDTVIRPFVGDVLVVVLLYFFWRIFLRINYVNVALGVLIFACLIEIGQYFDYVKLLGLENNRILSVAMGRTFEWSDFLAYFTGFCLIIAGENLSKIAKDSGRGGKQ